MKAAQQEGGGGGSAAQLGAASGGEGAGRVPPARSATEQRRLGEISFIYTYKKVPEAAFYFSGMKRDEWVAPIPGRPCFTGL